MANKRIGFRRWFFRGIDGSKSGLRRMFDWWLIPHILIALVLAFTIDTPLKDVSRVILLPLMGILIGLTFAWAGNAQGFIQTKEIIELSKNKPGGYVDYIFVYQFSIFMVLVCTGLWAVVAFDIKELVIFKQHFHPKYLTLEQKIGIKAFAYFILSFTIREAWSTIQGVHYFLIVKNKIYERDSKNVTIPTAEAISQNDTILTSEIKTKGLSQSHQNSANKNQKRKNSKKKRR